MRRLDDLREGMVAREGRVLRTRGGKNHGVGRRGIRKVTAMKITLTQRLDEA